MKYVYVLVGSKKGFYIEQTLVSMISLKHVCPSAKITLLIDDATDKRESKSLDMIRDLVDEYIVQQFGDDVSGVFRSRILKTTMRFLVDGDFLYVDSDTVWASPVDESVFTGDVMGVLDGHSLLHEHPLKHSLLNDLKKKECVPNDKYINGGVLFVKDSDVAKKMFSLWHEKWRETSKMGSYLDQPSLNDALANVMTSGDYLLPDYYNVQVVRTWKFFSKAKVIHYFAGGFLGLQENNTYIFQNTEFWENIKRNGINDFVMDCIRNPLEAFYGNVHIVDKIDELFHESSTYLFFRNMFARKMFKKGKLFNYSERLFSFLIKLRKKL